MMVDRIAINEPVWGPQIAEAAGAAYNAALDINICTVTDEVLQGGVMFSDYTGESIQAHIAGFKPHWLTRDLLWTMFHYPFNQLGVKRIFGPVPENNLKALEFDLKLGFTPAVRIEGIYPGNVACVLMRMDREDCRFLKLTPRSIQSNATIN
jgi:hypothetical protein